MLWTPADAGGFMEGRTGVVYAGVWCMVGRFVSYERGVSHRVIALTTIELFECAQEQRLGFDCALRAKT